MVKSVKYFFVFLLFVTSIYSQRMPERMTIFNPLFNEDKTTLFNEISWMNSYGGWAEFGGYVYDKDENHAWYQKLGAFFEFFRISNDKSLTVLSNIEFIADPHNDINFNPRAVFWEEAFFYSQRTGNNFWQAGYYHRCKHDVDNLDYGSERSLIYGSIHFRYIYNLINNEDLKILISARGDIYTILQDYRKPESIEEPSLEDLLASAALNVSFRNSFTKLIGITSSAFVQLNAFSNKQGFFSKFGSVDYVKPAAGIEAGISLSGNARFNLVLRYEFFADTGFDVIPASANLLSFGISFFPSEMF